MDIEIKILTYLRKKYITKSDRKPILKEDFKISELKEELGGNSEIEIWLKVMGYRKDVYLNNDGTLKISPYGLCTGIKLEDFPEFITNFVTKHAQCQIYMHLENIQDQQKWQNLADFEKELINNKKHIVNNMSSDKFYSIDLKYSDQAEESFTIIDCLTISNQDSWLRILQKNEISKRNS